MRKSPIALLGFMLLLFASNKLTAQQTIVIKGNIKNGQTKENLSAVSVTVKGDVAGTYTDEKGDFRLLTGKKPPFTIVITSIGYSTKEVNVESESQQVTTELEPSYALGQEIVVAASRVPERILESPVTIERINASTIRNAPGPNYYDALGNLKGVDVINSSYTFKTISTRGFNGSGNLRLNQLVDGMDNQAPALNFAVGNVIGVTDLDVDNMELLSGASSALYGSGGMNGTLLISSKDPFKYQGLSVQVKEGIMHVNDSRHGVTPFHDFSLRWGKKVSDKFAFKFGAEYIRANDWQANDSTDLERNNVLSNIKTGANTTRATDPNYDGVNVYGDEVSASMQGFAQVFQAQTEAKIKGGTGLDIVGLMNASLPANATQAQIGAFINSFAPFDPTGALRQGITNLVPFYFGLRNNIYDPTQKVSRTGYYEKNLVNYKAYDFKVSGGLYYNITNKLEASLIANWGLGTTVYTGADRYSLKNFQIGQYKLELKSPTWFLRAYTTQENSGDSYASTLTSISINRAWKDDATWFGQYVGTYSGYVLAGQDATTAHNAARIAADAGRYLPGTSQYESAFNKSIKTSINDSGSQFADRSSVYHFEGQYNFSQYVKVLDVLLGASYRIYHLNSGNTIFYEPDGPININEYGSYLQLQKQLFSDVLKLTASGRYDKNENFKGRFTPRATATIKVAKDNNFRLSYQQAYRFPNNQDQYINLFTPGSVLIGCLPVFNTLYQFDQFPVYTATSVDSFRTYGGDPSKLVKATFAKAKPETMESYEIGYRGVINSKLLIDVYFYWSKYKNFIGREAVARGDSTDPQGKDHPTNNLLYLGSPFTSTNYSFVENSPTPVKAHGWGISAEYQLGLGYKLMGNVYSDELGNVPDNFVTFFNTPKTRFNVGLSNPNLVKHFGFNVIYKWQDKTKWEGTFGSGQIPSFGTLDAQVSYQMPKQKILIKLGGTNITNHYYRNAFGNPYLGGLYYVSLGYDIF